MKALNVSYGERSLKLMLGKFLPDWCTTKDELNGLILDYTEE